LLSMSCRCSIRVVKAAVGVVEYLEILVQPLSPNMDLLLAPPPRRTIYPSKSRLPNN
jgi:hypothetical protein